VDLSACAIPVIESLLHHRGARDNIGALVPFITVPDFA
jgi:hypothetical protein